MRKLNSILTRVQLGEVCSNRSPDKARSSTGSAAAGVGNWQARMAATATSSGRKATQVARNQPCRGLPPNAIATLRPTPLRTKDLSNLIAEAAGVAVTAFTGRRRIGVSGARLADGIDAVVASGAAADDARVVHSGACERHGA